MPAVIPAAGGVLWRANDPDDGAVEVALVHRPRYDDWSLPKGKLLPGEHPLVGACREVAEETGVSPRVGRPLGDLRYPRTTADGALGEKLVRYWAMAGRPDGTFTPNEEIDEVVWLPPAEAVQRLSYPGDRAPVHRLVARPYRTTTLLLVRHGRAGDKASWPGEDRLRPLDRTGQKQAQRLAVVGPCFGPEIVYSAELTRCVDTVRPLAERLGVPVRLEPEFDRTAHARHPDLALRRLREIAAQGRPAVVCSQGEVIPDVLAALAAQDGVELAEVSARKGSVWALSFADGRLVDAEYFRTLAERLL